MNNIRVSFTKPIREYFQKEYPNALFNYLDDEYVSISSGDIVLDCTRRINFLPPMNLFSGEIPLKDLPQEYKEDYKNLLTKVNQFLFLGGFTGQKITSSFRSLEHHLSVYAKKGITDKSKIPLQSNHLYGRALDLLDTDYKLKNFARKEDHKVLKFLNLYMEGKNSKGEDATPTWLHLQTKSPASGKREFNI